MGLTLWTVARGFTETCLQNARIVLYKCKWRDQCCEYASANYRVVLSTMWDDDKSYSPNAKRTSDKKFILGTSKRNT